MSRDDRVGILALQGDVAEHARSLGRLGFEPILVRLPRDLRLVDRLIIPGGESTTIGKLLVRFGLLAPLRARIKKGMPVWGTCAGAILLAKRVMDGKKEQPVIGLMDMTVRRNAFGRQLDSFETTLSIRHVGARVPVFFIRAPIFEKLGKNMEVLAGLPDGAVVAAREKNMLATAFHPELAGSTAVHEYFLSL